MLLQLSPYQFSDKTTNKSEDKSLDNSADQSPVKNLNKDLFLNNNVLPSRDGEMEENSEKMLLKNSICQDTPKVKKERYNSLNIIIGNLVCFLELILQFPFFSLNLNNFRRFSWNYSHIRT